MERLKMALCRCLGPFLSNCLFVTGEKEKETTTSRPTIQYDSRVSSSCTRARRNVVALPKELMGLRKQHVRCTCLIVANSIRK